MRNLNTLRGNHWMNNVVNKRDSSYKIYNVRLPWLCIRNILFISECSCLLGRSVRSLG